LFLSALQPLIKKTKTFAFYDQLYEEGDKGLA